MRACFKESLSSSKNEDLTTFGFGCVVCVYGGKRCFGLGPSKI